MDINYDVADEQTLVASAGVGVLANYDLSALGAGVTIQSITVFGDPTVYVPGNQVEVAGWGTLTVLANGSFTFDPAPTAFGGFWFEFTYAVMGNADYGRANLWIGGSGSNYGPNDPSTSPAGTLEYHRTLSDLYYSEVYTAQDVFTVYDVPYHEGTLAGGTTPSLTYQIFTGQLANVGSVAVTQLPNSEPVSLQSSLGDFTFAQGQELVNHVVHVRQSVGDAIYDIQNALGADYGTSEMKDRIDRWFKGNAAGGEFQAPTQSQAETILGNFQAIANNFDTTVISYTNDDTYQGYGWNAAGNIGIGVWYHTGPGGAGVTPEDRFGTVIHEATHTVTGDDDYAYFENPGSLTAPDVTWLSVSDYTTPITVTTAELIQNPDSYAGFLTQYYY